MFNFSTKKLGKVSTRYEKLVRHSVQTSDGEFRNLLKTFSAILPKVMIRRSDSSRWFNQEILTSSRRDVIVEFSTSKVNNFFLRIIYICKLHEIIFFFLIFLQYSTKDIFSDFSNSFTMEFFLNLPFTFSTWKTSKIMLI